MKKTLILLSALLLCFALVSCNDKQGIEEKDILPHFVLNATETDAIDVFTAEGIEVKQWAKSTPTDWPLTVLVKKSSDPDAHFVKCFCDGYWRDIYKMAPATYHYVLAETDDSLFRMQIQCLNEEQGLCTVKFASSTITLRPASNGKRSDYVGTYEVKIGTGFKPRQTGVDCKLENVFYEATIEVIN